MTPELDSDPPPPGERGSGARPGADPDLDRGLAPAPPAWLDLLPDAVFAFDPADRVVLWNKGAERTYGLSADEAVGQSVLLFVPHAAQVAFVRACEAVRRSERWSGELLTQTATGVEVPVEARWAAGPDGVVVGTHTDIGDRKRVETRAEEARRWAGVRNLVRAVADELSTADPAVVTDLLRRFAAGPDPTNAVVFRGEGNRVVVAIDRPALRELVGATLAASGYRAIVADDRAATVRTVAEHPERVRAAVLGCGGETVAVARTLRRYHPLLPVIAVGPDARCEPSDAWLAEPCGPGELLPAVAAAVAEAIAADAQCGG